MVSEVTAKDRIYDLIDMIPGQTTREIADYLEMPYGSVRTMTSRLKNEGKVFNRFDSTWYTGAWYDVVGFETSPVRPEPKPKLLWWWPWAALTLPVISYLVGRYV